MSDETNTIEGMLDIICCCCKKCGREDVFKLLIKGLKQGRDRDILHIKEELDELKAHNADLLEKQRKKDEIFNMLLEACEKTLSENLHLTDGDDCTLFDLREATEKAYYDALENTCSESQELSELKAQNAVLREALVFYCNGFTPCGINEFTHETDVEIKKEIYEDRGSKAEQALYTTKSEALEAQRKKDEVFKMLVEAVEECKSISGVINGRGTVDACALCAVNETAQQALAAAKELNG